MRRHDLQIANFICTFGEAGELLDQLDEIVIPSFFDDTLVRSRGNSSYYIYEPFWIDLGSDGKRDLAIAGRFVKDTTLTREQVLQRGKLIEDYEEMQSSPSAFFVLLLRDHRLLYFGETAHAPDLRTFRSTMQIFLRKKWRILQAAMHSAQDNKLTHKQLRSNLPMPVLDIVPAAKSASIKKLLSEFDKITQVRFRLIRPNKETDASEVFQAVRDRLQPLDPARLDVELAQGQGLDPGETAEALDETAKGMNTDIIVRGSDEQGNKLKVENDDLALRIPIDDPPTARKSLSKRLYKMLKSQVQNGTVLRHQPVKSVRKKLKKLAKQVL